MRRGQYFSGNYGSALGSTANAANLIAQAGATQGQMFANLGQQIDGAIEKYAQNKKEGEAADMQIGAIIQNMTPERRQEIASGESELGKSLSKFIDGELPNSKKKALLGSLITVNTADQLKRKEQMDAQRFLQQQELTKLNMQIARQNLARQKDADQLAEQNRVSENQFFQKLPSLVTDPQAQRQADIARPGLAALGNGDARNRFMQAQLQDPRNQKRVIDLTDQDFLDQFKGDPQQIERALAFIEKRRAAQKPQKIARTITVQDGQGGFTQVGVDEAGNPVRDFGPPKPSGMYPTPEEQAKGKEDILSVENANDFVNKTRENSLDSAKSIRPATRALTLLEKGDLDTGGIAELKTNTIAMLDSLGIPIDKETMDKVANTQNFRAEVGKFLFENISNTKGSISEKEMDIFAKISPGLQMTPEANKVLLKYVIKKAERDKDRVKFIQDMRRKGVGIVEQRNRLEDYMIENDLSEVLSPIAGQPGEQSPQNTFNLNGQSVQGEVVGTKPNGDKLIKVNGQIFVQPAQ